MKQFYAMSHPARREETAERRLGNKRAAYPSLYILALEWCPMKP
jgi:hypothetical protein